MSGRVYSNSKDQILDAAEDILVTEGPGKLSVDAVCAKAKLSKGGFFYHFKTKDDLLSALVERLIVNSEQHARAFIEKDPNPKGRYTRAYIRSTFSIDEAKRKRQLALMRALLEVVSSSPKIIELAEKMAQSAFKQLAKDGIPKELAQVLAFATDGLMFAEALGTSPFNQKEQEALVRAMLKMTERTL